ncbi:MAG: PAS domain S-box protein, partial [Desulfobulbaceae bacterium]|nr:PAS domain S-box protein [Desulfobulbaceae bacterium]
HPCPFGGVLNAGRCHQCLLDDPAAAGEVERTRELRFADREGRMRTILIRLSKIVDRNGQLVKAVESFWDITSLKEAEIALHDSEERFRAMVETTSDWVWEVDREGRFVYCSPLCERIYGHAPAQLLGRHFFEALAVEEERHNLEQLFARCVAEGVGFQSVIHRYRHKDGQPRYVETSAVAVVDGMGKLIGFRGIDRDITERKRNEEERARLEEQYRQSQKMESLGTLAGGIAHDLNNVLTPIMCNAELANMLLEENHPARKKMADIVKCADRAADLIRRILAFSRKQVIKPKVMDLNSVVADLGKILRRLIREDIAIEFDLGADLLKIDGDPGQMEQILMNLVVNAGDAVAGNGRIVIRTRNQTVAAGTLIDVENLPIEGHFVVLAVSDNGTGMDEETVRRIFEPFFTTKAVGKGTGMGLATVYGIVQQHKGHIRLETEVGAGTTFCIYLHPAARQEVDEVKAEGDEIAGGSETILVAEDDPGVRAVLTHTLQNYGYRVVTATNGHDAVQVFGTAAGKVDLLITDVVMPGMHGDEVAKVLRKSNPLLPVIYISGHTFDMAAKDLESGGNSAFVQKPFRQATIAGEARRLLDGGGKEEV